MIKLDGVCEGLHSPFLTRAAHHGLNFVLKKALEGIQREHLIEASPVTIQAAGQYSQQVTMVNRSDNNTVQE